MRIQNMFQKDIDRPINGVIKVAEKSDEAVEQELSEYVVTHELAGHFDSFYRAYEHALESPTDEMGVWISGFFGSGKSHFLTMLSYLLENRVVAGKEAVGYFADKFENPRLYERVKRCAEVPTEAILFNIDSKNVGGQDRDALARTFARVFYDHLGFYGEDLKLARLEEFIDGKGKTAEFRARYEELTGDPWLETRESYEFNSDDVIGALVDCDIMSEAEAERYLEGDDAVGFSIDALASKIVAYAKLRQAEEGGMFRLLFMVDEVGQFVGNGKDTARMLNLQSIVEELGAKGKGLVWVMVTSQEAIDQVASMSGKSDDFSKITGRFKCRLSLSGIDADEVIKRRLLEKNENARDLLAMVYDQKASALKNLFHFKAGTAKEDLGGYPDAGDFIEAYPFVTYQFTLLQTTLTEIRRHGSSGKHTSGSERSMLSGFQEAAQAVEDEDENALVPFWRFYDTIQTFLEGHVRRVINRADEAACKGQGLEPVDVEVLKLLFLIRWVNDVESNPENIAILMVDSIDANLLEMRRTVGDALTRLMRQNYVGRSGETYQFLTDDEQEIARAISNTIVEPSRITDRLGQIIFGEIFDSNKLRYGENDFDVEKYVDETRCGAPGGMVLRIMTAASGPEATSHEALLMRSQQNEAVCLLSDDTRYYDLIQDALRIEVYANTQNVSRQPENVQRIIRDRRSDAQAELREARDLLEEGIRKGTYYAGGYEVKAQGSSAKAMLSNVLEHSVESVYPKLPLITTNYHTDLELTEILHGKRTLDGSTPNEGAVDEMKRYLENQHRLHLDTPMAEVQKHFQERPFGWREIDVAAVAALLLAAGDAKLTYAGTTVDITSAGAVNRLRKATETRNTLIDLRIKVPEHVRRTVRDVITQVTGQQNLPLEEDELTDRSAAALKERLEELQRLLDHEYRRGNYPGREYVEHGISIIKGVLAAGNDPSDLLPRIADAEDDLGDAAENLEDVFKFFPNQQRIWDNATALDRKVQREREYLAANQDATEALDTIERVLAATTPYKQIHLLSGAMQTVEDAYNEKLKDKKRELLDRIESIYADIETKAQQCDVQLAAIAQRALTRRNAVHDTTSLSELDALTVRLGNDQTDFYAKIDAEVEKRKPEPPTSHICPKTHTPPAPKPRIRRVERNLVFKPETLKTEAEIDRYLERVREELLRNLAGNDGIRIQ
ncbi:BREX system P-loop protein BrxC [Enorma phocaeensis]|uniref:BREX system P-loop protein BrxC n=1 Tax=Enorma phocaeensis TaxID=1871019 RepID=UPI002351FD54|nr:BREX system P-loop protein BrxC [Enorma phocaeensis]